MLKEANTKEIVILVPGLMRSSKSMFRLGRFLIKHNYEIYLYDYPSTKYKIAEHGKQFQTFIENIFVNNPAAKLHFITHSLGGIITREALGWLRNELLVQCGSLIMLSPPSRGSLLAHLFIKYFPFLSSIIKPLPELSHKQDAYVHQVAVPNKLHIGIIAGRFDAKTPPSATQLKEQKDFIIINSAHTFIMNHSKTKKAILEFLQKGVFLSPS